MKKIASNKKLIYIIASLLIIVGIVMIIIKGFNYELKYDKNQNIEIYLNKEIDIKEIEEIAKSVFNEKKVLVEYVEVFKDTVNITANEITEQEKESLIQKVNEKYELEKEGSEVKIVTNQRISLYDILKQYVFTLSLSSIVIVIYFVIRYRKIGILNVLVNSILTIILSQLVLFSIIAIVRFPIGKYLLTLILTVFVMSIIDLIIAFEKENKNIKQEKKK